MSASTSNSAASANKTRKNHKLKVAYITPISRNTEAFYNFTQPRRTNTSITKSRDRQNSTNNNTSTNISKSTHYKKNNSRDNYNNYINISNCKRSSYIKTDYTYSRPSTNRSSSYIKGTCYLKSPYNYGNAINMYHIYNTSHGVAPCVSYRNATPQNSTYNNVHRQLMRSTSTTQQLVSKRSATQRNGKTDVGSSHNNIKVFSCVMKDSNSQGDCNRLNTQSSYCSNSCTFSQNSLFRTSCDIGIGVSTVNAKKNSITKTKESSSQNSNSNTTSSKGREGMNRELYKKKIDTPEDLHFFYVHVIQNGKQYEHKF